MCANNQLIRVLDKQRNQSLNIYRKQKHNMMSECKTARLRNLKFLGSDLEDFKKEFCLPGRKTSVCFVNLTLLGFGLLIDWIYTDSSKCNFIYSFFPKPGVIFPFPILNSSSSIFQLIHPVHSKNAIYLSIYIYESPFFST
jgi:hypothetical protein